VNLKALGLGILTWFQRVGAVLFLAVLAAVAAFCFTKALNRESAKAIWGILRGEQVAVAPADRDRWQELDRQAEKNKSQVEKQEEEGSGQVRELLKKDVQLLADQLRKEWMELEEFSKLLAERQRQYDADLGQLKAARLAFQDQQTKFNDARRDESLRKVLKLYAGMDAEIIAGDFEDRLKAGDQTTFNEVVDILRRMPERQASEVLSAMAKPDSRNKLMEALKKS
jgi:hypothetical protein